MKKRGKAVTLYMIDGEATGRIKCTLSNWTGIAYKIPRINVEESKTRLDLQQSGVYFLFGVDEETNKYFVYVGQSSVRQNDFGIINRIIEHKSSPDKGYWTEAVIFTTSNNSFGPTEISFLEHKFYNMVKENTRGYITMNKVVPTLGNVTEEKESELEEYIDYVKIVMGALGYKIFEPYSYKKNESKDLLYCSRKNRETGFIAKGIGKETSDGFLVLKGSVLSNACSNSMPQTLREKRKEVLIDENFVLQEDILFSSPSYASNFVLGSNTNGLDEWKTKEGIKLKTKAILKNLLVYFGKR